MKKKNIKIKHRKYSLYQRKKSKGRKFLTGLLMVILVAGLCVLGYGLGKPLVEYFSNRGNEPPPESAWTPPVSAEPAAPSAEGTAEKTAESSEPTAEPEIEKTVSAFILPETAALSSESLNSALAAAKNSGCTDITVTLKDEAGSFLYKTALKDIPESQITGTLTAKQIADIITRAGMTPHARINTLLDRTSQTYSGGSICYMIADGGIWHDYYVDKGGKSWLDPFEKETAAYLADITKEIASADFTDVILANMRYPAFNPLDYTNFLRQLNISDETARLEALWNVISACQKAAGDTRVTIEMNDEDLFADNNAIALTTAEAAGDKTKLKTAALLVDYSPADKTGYAETRAFIGKLSAMYSGQEWAVRIQTSGFSAASLEQVRKAFADSGITMFSE